ncbi:hypothetical protein [Hyphomicrobium sp. D-2]|uniref:hypothetical protein n=1 Tax=Hyphomicrobium sp. D-2 TaxID=3041621 RepID=UPI002458ACA4|nr:hypothetical protein [Hyphomicrobium sp. D-2]MDH4982124.1 hypothetical protein [Hyphomicrobium sp. D-2]
MLWHGSHAPSWVLYAAGIPIWQEPNAIRTTELVREYDATLQKYWGDLLDGKLATNKSALEQKSPRQYQV